MKTAVVYTTKHGTTVKIAGAIGQALGGATLIDLKTTPAPDLSGFNAVVAGGPVYAGQPLKRLRTYLAENCDTLLGRSLALFVCRMEQDASKRATEMAAAFPQALRVHAVGTWFAGGEFKFDQLGFMEKTIVKKIVGVTSSVTNINDDVPTEIAAALEATR